MWFLLLTIFIIILTIILRKLNEDYYILSLCKRVKAISSKDKVLNIPGNTIFGNSFDMLNLTPGKGISKEKLYSI